MKNMGTIDRSIRAVAGALFIIAAVVLQVTTGRFWWVGLFGLVFIATSLMAFCPLYLPFGIRTNKR